MKTLQNFFESGILGFGLVSGIVKLFLGFGAIVFSRVSQDEMTPQNFLMHRYGGGLR